MNILMLVNPIAGKKQGIAVSQRALQLFNSQNVTVKVIYSERPRHLIEIAKDEVGNGWDGIAAVGGDGTLFEVINGMAQGNPDLPAPLGVIPVGTGNSFSRDLNIASLDDAVCNMVRGNTRRVDLGKFTVDEQDYYFINIIGFGFVADVAERASLYKKWGALSYIIGVFQVTRRLQSYQMTFEIDGVKYERDNVFVEICNSTRTGGDMIMAPDAKIDDGLLDVVVLNKLSRRKLLATFPRIFKGTHIHIPEITTFKARDMTFYSDISKILTPDGEIFGNTPLSVSVVPGKIRVFDA
ncbi:MAG: diacylglycerol kinase family protein [candidate division KSB1 bacterium]|nr:diacylglycerol kinase family protein [candidate division KSB1 bacterium]